MQDQFSRTRALLGQAAIDRLAESRVAIFGLGGVGGHATEALCRSGVGRFAIFDNDTICITNLNRQIIATHRTIGRYKTDVMAERILEINPKAEVETHRVFYGPDVAGDFDFSRYDYIVDAIDTVSAKLELVMRAAAANAPIICAMGAANKLDSTALEVTDLFQTEHDALARVMRRELRKRGVTSLKVVYSKEPARAQAEPLPLIDTVRRQIPASNAFVPGTAGLILAGEVVKALIS